MKTTITLKTTEIYFIIEFLDKAINDIDFIKEMGKKVYDFNEINVNLDYVIEGCKIIMSQLIDYINETPIICDMKQLYNVHLIELDIQSLYMNHFFEWLAVQSVNDTKKLFKNYSEEEIETIDNAMYTFYCELEEN